MKGITTITLLVIANLFMTFAWYGHLKMKDISWFSKLNLFTVILFSWGLAFFEYCFQVPANKIGYVDNGGPFSLFQLKVIQEIITLTVFIVFSTLYFPNEHFKMNHFISFVLLIGAVYFAFKN
ncbi:MAG: DMT family protein [Saprospiraceae bacterium]